MQTPNDEDESWKDIKAWGYDEQLKKAEVAAKKTLETESTPTTEA